MLDGARTPLAKLENWKKTLWSMASASGRARVCWKHGYGKHAWAWRIIDGAAKTISRACTAHRRDDESADACEKAEEEHANKNTPQRWSKAKEPVAMLLAGRPADVDAHTDAAVV